MSTKRAHWQCQRVLYSWLQHYHHYNTQRTAAHTAELCYINKHWPVWIHGVQVHKQLRRSVTMGEAVNNMRTVVTALTRWRDWQHTQTRIHTATTTAVYNRRCSLLQSHLLTWQQCTLTSGERAIRQRQAFRHYKYSCWKKLLCRLHVLRSAAAMLSTTATITNNSSRSSSSTKLISTTTTTTLSNTKLTAATTTIQNSPTPSTKQKPRYILFRGRLFQRKYALLRLLRHNIRSSLQQQTALTWGKKW